jgi:acetamidase/formamidase
LLDMHASMGNGEVCFTGVEIDGAWRCALTC